MTAAAGVRCWARHRGAEEETASGSREGDVEWRSLCAGLISPARCIGCFTGQAMSNGEITAIMVKTWPMVCLVMRLKALQHAHCSILTLQSDSIFIIA